MWARSALRLTNARQRPPKIARTRLKVLYPRKLTSPVAKTWKNNGIRWNNRAQTHGIEGARVGFALLRCVGSEEAPHRLVADDDKADIWIDRQESPPTASTIAEPGPPLAWRAHWGHHRLGQSGHSAMSEVCPLYR